MVTASLRTLALAAVAGLTLVPASAAAVTLLGDCAELTKAGETYVVTANITAAVDACFRVQADRITLDLGGYTISRNNSPFTGMGVSDDRSRRTSTVVRNGTITNFGWGLFLAASTRTTVRNVTVLGNTDGMEIGPDSLVKA